MNAPVNSNLTPVSDTEKTTILQKAGVGAMCAAAFLMLYFLLAGPLVWIEGKMKFPPFSRSVKVIYAPLARIVKSDIEPASSIVKAYVGLFKK
ncbi:MAG: hypothetical protein KDA74_14490 [Planctomycetaceae bacterium]|nr:hypothetical protein [Planctomycetaceae bacterium]